MLTLTHIILSILALLNVASTQSCGCGYKLAAYDGIPFYTHRIVYDFSTYKDDIDKMLTDDKAKDFRNDWILYDYWQRADNPEIRVDAKYDHQNVQIKDGLLVLEQKGFEENPGAHVSMSGIQTKRLDIGHGTFKTVFKVTSDDGGSCASFFWYKNDSAEIDVEIVTKGTSLVEDSINWTTHPALDAGGLPIPGATLRRPLSKAEGTNIDEYREYRFDWDDTSVKYFLDGKQVHEDDRVPAAGGNLQLKLWADGNRWWSSKPSRSTVTMSVKEITAYFNVTVAPGEGDIGMPSPQKCGRSTCKCDPCEVR